MNIFINTITFKIADDECFYLCPLTHNIFKERKDANVKAKILRSCDH